MLVLSVGGRYIHQRHSYRQILQYISTMSRVGDTCLHIILTKNNIALVIQIYNVVYKLRDELGSDVD